MKKCMGCGKLVVKNKDYDLCYLCWQEKEETEEESSPEERFQNNLDFNKIPTTYIMFYGTSEYKIGYTNDLNSRMIEIKRVYPYNKLVYFREFGDEINARRFEAWLKKLTPRDLHRFISTFQDKTKKIQIIS